MLGRALGQLGDDGAWERTVQPLGELSLLGLFAHERKVVRQSDELCAGGARLRDPMPYACKVPVDVVLRVQLYDRHAHDAQTLQERQRVCPNFLAFTAR